MGADYEVTIGLEVHAQLDTNTKIFCSCSTEFGAEPNVHTCPVCLGLPGVLPVLNKKAVEYAIKTGLALNCDIASFSKFDRKNYFYPDLPKAYQISQFDLPLCTDGHINVKTEDEEVRVRINRIHMEEDAGKLVHDGTTDEGSLVDYNRVGTPLIEIVTEPDIHSPAQAVAYLKELKSILEYLEVSDCNMAEGSLRCDANASIKPKGQEELGTKTELKNMNSFKAIEKALKYEIKRQAKVLNAGKEVIQETRMWDDDLGKTFSMRGKEEAHDYRYFPEPDLVPMEVDESWLEKIEEDIPELPTDRKARFINEFGLPEYDAEVLTDSKDIADFFEATVNKHDDPKSVSNWVMGDLMRLLNEENLEINEADITADGLAEMLALMDDGTISSKIAKTVFEEMFKTGKDPDTIVEEKGLKQISDEDELGNVIDGVIENNPDAVADYKGGKDQAIGYLVGQVMKETRGKADPQLTNQMLREKLS
ncbi:MULTISPECIES: Asp-tRNA(Asn)/Glu-tRNA(Gln) amidotransferase subunit GatB [unclassified Candidatus Frackibacter]|uniref:Asp-tRNA(Asn)/Glu-tRNA(Gln) amidotransferase subunit GatB n=1 Tax=unclassified Candidatus Frackibacter TaxID=2648818 RepID=UPI00079804CE|nr:MULTISPECIES: Asp-tRNA(Asn)/Glu-tRNA(Gln) amidotransferase subunit GatB [unclassified Candidatus Frackibacter]KXS45271.1 MAG: aspartyl-tRNA(Asn)/glutamyl-tRNA (Gln) amidotransferase subunit B [Candidatus Frackibacter sp. T328-2]SDC79193.1 aspartyl/glutamyl-tRNA(Asn/Gln) amidotransferase subunit B [Candidatus Frackibacter sp. WG11]SEM91934.1 aspartyl/glutamyl-tRNA(Asn/Gln) amidotransferase subunit B [Candidatus Frackibacter sp. WG12]SFM01698.1 aspartyl/glutamyl-tRNA(Asn/Gln) amidotransferase 